jgi:hypothetical protein
VLCMVFQRAVYGIVRARGCAVTREKFRGI